jgi:hypothetical protein
VFGGEATGGERVLRDGALIDPATGRARRVPDLGGVPLMSPAAVASGRSIVVMGFACARTYHDPDLGDLFCTDGGYAAAELDPASRRWRPIVLPDELTIRRRSDVGDAWSVRPLGTLSDGRAVFATVNAVPAGGELEYRTKFWTYTPKSKAWDAVPAPPGVLKASCLAGDRIVGLVGTPNAPALVVFDLIGSANWRVDSPDGTVALTDEPRMSCAADHVVVTGLRQGPPTPADILSVAVATIDDGAWIQGAGPGYPEPIPDTRRGVGLLGSGLWTGQELVFPTAAYAYSPATRTWRELTTVPPHDGPLNSVVWTGDGVAGYFTTTAGNQPKASVYSYALS